MKRSKATLPLPIIVILVLFAGSSSAQVVTANTIQLTPGDEFSYDNQLMPHYGLKWTSDSWTGAGPSAWFSAFGGIKFFTGGQSRMVVNESGNIGIGTTSPSTLLDVRGVISTPEIAFRNADGGDDSDPYRLRKVQQSPNVNWLELQLNDDADESFRIYGNSCEGYSCGTYSNNLYHSFDAAGNAYHANKLGIGTTNNTPHRLAVNGSAIFTKAVVKNYGTWPDYVFDSTYRPTSLVQLEQYIKTNKHLPDVPSSAVVEKEGLDLGATQAALLKKIEELTLYILEQNKQMQTLTMQVKELQQKIK